MKIVSKAAALDCLALGVTFDYDLPFLILYWRQILMYCTGDLPCLILLRCLWKSRLFRVFSLSLVSACFWEEELCPGSESQEPQSFSLPWTVSPLNSYLLSPLYHPEFNTQMKWIKLNLSLLKVNIQRTSTNVDLWLNIFNKPTYKQQVDQTFNQKLLNSNTNNKLNKKSP